MDKFDAMTVTDTKYLFYDIDMNDFSEPAELFCDIVNFLDLIYDIGIGPTAEEKKPKRHNENDKSSFFKHHFFELVFNRNLEHSRAHSLLVGADRSFRFQSLFQLR